MRLAAYGEETHPIEYTVRPRGAIATFSEADDHFIRCDRVSESWEKGACAVHLYVNERGVVGSTLARDVSGVTSL